jgi:hypothetical protein
MMGSISLVKIQAGGHLHHRQPVPIWLLALARSPRKSAPAGHMALGQSGLATPQFGPSTGEWQHAYH